MRMIDADALIKRWDEMSVRGRTEFDQEIMVAPSIDIDRPQGEWIDGDIPTRCSICGHDWDEYVEGQEIWYEGSIPNFCPNCGARMKGADDE